MLPLTIVVPANPEKVPLLLPPTNANLLAVPAPRHVICRGLSTPPVVLTTGAVGRAGRADCSAAPTFGAATVAAGMVAGAGTTRGADTLCAGF
jgi:hypothetical protein